MDIKENIKSRHKVQYVSRLTSGTTNKNLFCISIYIPLFNISLLNPKDDPGPILPNLGVPLYPVLGTVLLDA